MNSFTFYKNYYELIRYLSDEQRLLLYDGILKYMFENKEPKFNNLLYGIWVNLKMPLNTSKNNSGRGGRPKKKENPLKTDSKPKENPLKTEKKTNNISYFLFLISNNNYKYINNSNSNIYNKIIEWLEYKQERKEIYKEVGLRNLISEIENNIELYGEDNIIKLISYCMANNYKGIIFEKLKNIKTKKVESVPEWFNKNIKENKADEQEIKKLEERLKNY